MKATFELKGIMPLLMHQDDVEASDELQAWRKDPSHKNISVPGDDRSPAWTWQTYCYSDGKHLAMPTHNIMTALRSAGTQMIMKRQKTYKEATQNGMLIFGEHCDFFVGDNQVPFSVIESMRDDDFAKQKEKVRKHGFELYVKRAKVGTSKHVRVRPRFANWTVRGAVDVWAPEITFEILDRLFSLAGRVGLCDWRPGCKTPGVYGMFSSVVTAA